MTGEREDDFDRELGVSTEKTERIYRLRTVCKRFMDANHYRASDSFLAKRLIAELPIRPNAFCFVDIGCGKGRILISAAQAGFARIIGVEQSPDLIGICQRNLELYARHFTSKATEVLCLDASEFSFPPENLVVYMYNPVRGRTMRAIIGNLRVSWTSSPREIFILYVSPTCERMFDGEPWLEKLRSGPGLAIYRSNVRRSLLT